MRDLYVANIELYRDSLTTENLPSDFSVPQLLARDNDAMMTYRGYIKFLAKDLARSDIVSHESNKKFKKATERIAKKMIFTWKGI